MLLSSALRVFMSVWWSLDTVGTWTSWHGVAHSADTWLALQTVVRLAELMLAAALVLVMHKAYTRM